MYDTVHIDDENRYRRLEESKTVALPQRPGRLSVVLLIMCIVSRLELLRWLQRRPQCAHSGVEVSPRSRCLLSNPIPL